MRTTIAALLVLTAAGCSCHTIEPGNKGVMVSWGVLKEPALDPGFNTLGPGSDIHDVSIRSHKEELNSECFSSDLQQVKVKIAILYRIPESQVIRIFKEYNGAPFDVLIAPRTQEALKEATASRSAERIVKERESVKTDALQALRKKINGESVDGGLSPDPILIVEDLIIENIDLSKELEVAIEQKMIQEQEAAKAKFTKLKAEIDADTALVKAQGEANSTLAKAKAEAEAIKIRGDALAKNPAVVQLELINKWKGEVPQVVSGSNGTNILLPAMQSSAK